MSESNKPVWTKTTQYPKNGDELPPALKTVLLWVEGYLSPFLGCLETMGGLRWTLYDRLVTDVVAWCDCLPEKGPDGT